VHSGRTYKEEGSLNGARQHATSSQQFEENVMGRTTHLFPLQKFLASVS